MVTVRYKVGLTLLGLRINSEMLQKLGKNVNKEPYFTDSVFNYHNCYMICLGKIILFVCNI